MPKLETMVVNSNKINQPITKLCKIKKYLPIKEKFEFIEKYQKVLKEHIRDYPEYPSYVAFLFFNLMVMQAYTDIEFELSYESFDKFQERGWIDEIVGNIGSDYTLLLQLVRSDNQE